MSERDRERERKRERGRGREREKKREDHGGVASTGGTQSEIFKPSHSHIANNTIYCRYKLAWSTIHCRNRIGKKRDANEMPQQTIPTLAAYDNETLQSVTRAVNHMIKKNTNFFGQQPTLTRKPSTRRQPNRVKTNHNCTLLH